MTALGICSLCSIFVLAIGRHHTALRSTKLSVSESASTSYTFAKFITNYGRSYVEGTDEYTRRSHLFTESLQRIKTVNAKNDREGRPWVAGTHAFMDWTPEEKKALQGYKPSDIQQHRRAAMAALQVRTRSNLTAAREDSFIGQGARPRSQGHCGSCWAISAAEAVEAQLKKSGEDVQVSAQALVDCVPNPQHCGGSGGCDGGTGELAYAFMRDHGIPLETDLPYRKTSSFSEDEQPEAQCLMEKSATNYPTKRRAVVDGWDAKPSNHADGLMQALVDHGSAVVAVEADGWFDYSKGVYDGCQKDAILSHAVLAKGYGKDAETGTKFWLIQNSWGTGWGEKGDIRLLRHDKDDDWCGTDNDPSKGLGCDGGPATVPVCGMCGILYDPLVPTGVRIVDDADVGSTARVSQGDYTPWRPK